MNPLFELFYDDIDWPEDMTHLWWIESGDEVSYNTDNNTEDLLNGDGNSYSAEIYRNRYVNKDGYVLYTLRDGCGGFYQAIFSLDKKQSHYE